MSVRRLQRALTRSAKLAEKDLLAAVSALAEEHLRRLTGPEHRSEPLERVSRALSCLSAAADLSGRLGLRFGAPGAEPDQFGAEEDVVPVVAFDEAIQDLRERNPIGAAELQRLGLEVEDVYGSEPGPDGRPFYRHAFAAARAVDEEVAKAVRERLVSGLVAGVSTPRVAENLMGDWSWPRSYAETVVRTTYTTATTAGRFREAERVQGSGIPVGFRFSCVVDADLRQGRPQDHGENHKAMEGLIARADDPIWRSWSPPLGFR